MWRSLTHRWVLNKNKSFNHYPESTNPREFPANIFHISITRPRRKRIEHPFQRSTSMRASNKHLENLDLINEVASHESFHKTEDPWKTPGSSTGPNSLHLSSRKIPEKSYLAIKLNRDAQKKRTKKSMFNAGKRPSFLPTTPSIHLMDWSAVSGLRQCCLGWTDKEVEGTFWEWFIGNERARQLIVYPPTPRLFRGGGEKKGVGDT